jgi:hypothetical protein
VKLLANYGEERGEIFILNDRLYALTQLHTEVAFGKSVTNGGG